MTRVRSLIFSAFCVLAVLCAPALADITVKDGSSADQVIFDFTCFTTKHCSAHVPINSAGTEIFTTSNPANVVTYGMKDSGGTDMTDTTNHALKVVGVGLSDDSSISGKTGSGIMGKVEATAGTVTDGASAWLGLTTKRAARVDLYSISGTAADTNSGNKSAGTQRNVLATDQLALATWGHVATGAAPPSGSTYISALGSGATGGLTRGLITCDQSAKYDASTSGSTELVALTSGRTIYVCGYTIKGDAAVNVKWVYGTGTNCGTGSTDITPAFKLGVSGLAIAGIGDSSPFWRGLKTASANALCINASGAVAVQAIVYYAVI